MAWLTAAKRIRRSARRDADSSRTSLWGPSGSSASRQRRASSCGSSGGVAVRLQAPTLPPAFERQYKDLDLAAPKGGANDADRLLRAAEYQLHAAFNALNRKERMLFFDAAHDSQVDVFVGTFRMCDEIPFSHRLAVQDRTVPLADLLLTTLQIIELNEKDVGDTLLLVHGHEVADRDGDAINGARIAELCPAAPRRSGSCPPQESSGRLLVLVVVQSDSERAAAAAKRCRRATRGQAPRM